MQSIHRSATHIPLLLFGILLVLTACGGGGDSSDASSAGAQADPATQSQADVAPTLPESLFSAQPPAGAVPLHQARAEAKAGDQVHFHGYIGGRAEPFVEGRALFVMADSQKAPACTDGCAIPWDACCVPGDVIAANSATIRVLGEDDRMLAVDLEGHGGLKPGARVAISGTVAQADESVFIVDASQIVAEGGQ